MTERSPHPIPLLKSLLVACIGAFALLVGLDNLLDYGSNWAFVQHVLAMDTVFPDNQLRWRAITDPLLQRVFYAAIILCEWVMALACLAGAWRLFRARRDLDAFIAAKSTAAIGLTLVVLLYYLGFVVVGGEWFCMWQSATWNGQGKAAMFAGCAMAVLILLLVPEERAAAGPRDHR